MVAATNIEDGLQLGLETAANSHCGVVRSEIAGARDFNASATQSTFVLNAIVVATLQEVSA